MLPILRESGAFQARDFKAEKMEVNKTELLSSSPQEIVQRFKEVEDRGELEGFIQSVVVDDELLALVSWWERWLSKNQIKVFDAAVLERRHREPTQDWELPLGLEKKFSEEELKLIFSNMGAVQLTFGCSVGCHFCAFDALPGARENLPFKQVKNLLEKYGDVLPKGERPTESTQYKTFLYYASDPADYVSEMDGVKKTYKDVHELAAERTGSPPFVSTREIQDKDWLDYVHNLPGQKRVSTLGLAQQKIGDLRKKMGDTVHVNHLVRGIGRDLKKDPSWMARQGGGIGCYDGTLLTPRGLYNTVQVAVSERFPQGMIVVPLEKLADVDIASGDSLIKALRFGIALNTPISEYGVNPVASGKYNGGTEFIVFLNKRKKYLVVDKNFVIQEIREASKIEEEFERVVKDMEEKSDAAEKSKEFALDFKKEWQAIWAVERLSRYPIPHERFYKRAVAASKRMDKVTGINRT